LQTRDSSLQLCSACPQALGRDVDNSVRERERERERERQRERERLIVFL